MFLAVTSAWTASTNEIAGGYFQRRWMKEHGLPDNEINALLQTRDGYLWIGTREGLARFDGSRFAYFSCATHPEFLSDHITALAEDIDRQVWVGTPEGLMCQGLNGWVHFTQTNGLEAGTISVLTPSSHGGLWVGGDHGVSLWRQGKWSSWTKSEGVVTNVVSLQELGGNLWIGTAAGLQRLDLGTSQLSPAVKPPGARHPVVYGLARGATGELVTLIGHDSLDHARFYARTNQWGDVSVPVLSNRGRTLFCAPDTQGGFLLPHSEGVGRFRNDQFQALISFEAHGSDPALCLLEDRSGTLWLGTEASGLFQFSPRRVQLLSTNNGLPDDDAWAVCQTQEGTIWLGSDGGLTRLQNGVLTTWTENEGLTRNHVRALAEDNAGGLWIGTLAGLNYYDGTRITQRSLPGAPLKIRALHVGADHGLWIGALDGLHYVQDTKVQTWTTKDGLDSEDILAVFEDRKGILWIGTEGGGLHAMRQGVIKRVQPSDGLPGGSVWAFHQDREGALWMCTDRGLSRHREGRFHAFTSREGLFNNAINCILEDDLGNFWLSSDNGIGRVSKHQLDEVAAGRLSAVHCVVYGEREGLISSETNGRRNQPAGWTTRDGRIWFPTVKGMVVFDPSQLPDDTNPPPVSIEQIRANGRVVLDNASQLAGPAPTGELDLQFSPGSAHILEIQYTACVFSSADQVLFRYRLEGLDEDWIDARRGRRAYYANLRPGQYQFQVQAMNKYGLWSAGSARFRFELLPRFQQTPLFYGVCSVIVLGAGFGLHRWRLKYLGQIHRLKQQWVVAQERERVAKDLHDGLGSKLTQLTLLAQASPHADQVQQAQLRSISDLAHETASNLKEIIWANQPQDSTVEGLAARLAMDVPAILHAAGVRCRLDLPEQDGSHPLTADGRHHLYLAVKEAVNNVVKHAAATEVRLSMTTSSSMLSIVVEDDGCGFDTESARLDHPAAGHGLRNMRHRLEVLGGQFNVRSAPGHGTRLEFIVPIQNNES